MENDYSKLIKTSVLLAVVMFLVITGSVGLTFWLTEDAKISLSLVIIEIFIFFAGLILWVIFFFMRRLFRRHGIPIFSPDLFF